jgi:hypothetical protein
MSNAWLQQFFTAFFWYHTLVSILLLNQKIEWQIRSQLPRKLPFSIRPLFLSLLLLVASHANKSAGGSDRHGEEGHLPKPCSASDVDEPVCSTLEALTPLRVIRAFVWPVQQTLALGAALYIVLHFLQYRGTRIARLAGCLPILFYT